MSKQKKTINHLVQLQDLCVAKDQQAAMAGTQLEELEHNITTMMDELSDPVGIMFKKLQNKGPVAIVPISGPVCTACGMSLPASLVQSVKLEEVIQQCPNCARMMYFSSIVPKGKPRKTRRLQAPKVGIERFSAPELMIQKIAAKTRDEAITELCTHMETEGFIEDSEVLIQEALKREAIVSTALDNGLAFPHVRGVEGGGLTLTLGLSKTGIKFGNPKGRLTRIIFFMVIPTAASAFYLRLLSGLTRVFQDKEKREKLLEAKDDKEAWKLLARLTKSTLT